MTNSSARQQAIDAAVRDALGVGLDEWVAAQRADVDPATNRGETSWDTISLRLYRLTGETVSRMTLYRWFDPKAKRKQAA